METGCTLLFSGGGGGGGVPRNTQLRAVGERRWVRVRSSPVTGTVLSINARAVRSIESVDRRRAHGPKQAMGHDDDDE